MTSDGRSRSTRYAGGGVADRPQLAMFGEWDAWRLTYRCLMAGTFPFACTDRRRRRHKTSGIVNAFDVSVVGDYLGSAAGERLIINAVQRNSRSVRQAIA